MKLRIFSTLVFIFLTFASFCQTYDTYDEAYEAFLNYGKQKAFAALESRYQDCKHMDWATLADVEEGVNALTGRMDVVAQWNFKYRGCYWGIHKYTGTARAKGYITRDGSGQFKYGFRGADVVRYDREK